MKKNNANKQPKNKKLYQYWQALYLSFYSRAFYLDVAQRWRGYGLRYFLLVVALSALPIAIKTAHNFNHYYDKQLVEPLKKMPTVIINKGKLTFDYFMPFLIKNAQGDVVVIIDTQGQLTKINYIYPHWMMLVTEDAVYFRPPKFSILPTSTFEPADVAQDYKALSFEGIDFESFNASMWLDGTGFMQQKWLVLCLIYPLFVGLLFGFFSGLNAMMAILGKALSHTVFKFRLGYKEAYRLMMVSSGCGISIFIMALSYNGNKQFMGLYLMIAVAFYFSFAVLSVRRTGQHLIRR